MNRYKPRPVDTSSVILPEGIRELVELLAENVHEVWAAQRLAEGWIYGTRRNDEKKEHPCLVPYVDLPEEEKEYDRRTALQTIKTIIGLGYRIVPTEEEGRDSSFGGSPRY